jgi:putative ABC transport system permease protein
VVHNVTDAYFELMGIRLVSGRRFGPVDRFSESELTAPAGSAHGVAIVTESVARTLWPDRSAIGQALWLPGFDNVAWREVVGVTEDIRFQAVDETPALHVFVPWTQYTIGRPRLLVKGARESTSSASVVRNVVQAVEPGTQIDQIATLDALIRRATAQPRFTSRTVAMFGALALLLAAVGIYGTLSYIVGARRREIAIRLALGASRHDIVSSIVWRGLTPAIAGGLVGLAIAATLARMFGSLLFDVEPFDVGSLISGAVLLLLVALGAAMGPARRASRADPACTLHAE